MKAIQPWLRIAGVIGLLALSVQSAPAQTCDGWMARVISVQGVVEAKRAEQTEWAAVYLDDTFCLGDMIRVDARSRAALALPNETVIRLDQDTTLTFAEPQGETKSWLELLKGAVHVISRNPRALKVLTPFANAGLEGTEFLIEVVEDQTTVTVFQGEVTVSNDAGEVGVTRGQSVAARSGQLSVVQQPVRPRDAVQWTLYYPPIQSDQPGASEQADPAGRSDDPEFYTARAFRQLNVGRVAEARADLSTALSLAPGNSMALALQSIIAVTQNQNDAALQLAERAVTQDPSSSAALIALSYAQQANFDIDSAVGSLQRAVTNEPDNALAWARLAELRLATGDLDYALEAAHKAVALNPDLALSRTVLGFAYLARVKTAQAKEAFRAAIASDQAAPLPRLGLGLAEIREGNLLAGREEIEIAVILDTNNAMLRSYMGKAYYDEKRDALAESQFEEAKILDPLDPTAWFYDSIRKQTTNRPVESMHDQQVSIALNDNRAVYRSRLLLDQDLAARSASLGRIYRNLGFEQLALVEGWKSVNTDPSNFSGHRFLADTLSGLPRTQISRVNELFQSQLLQPINITPIQPQLADTNLFILDSAGPADLAFNEFNPLFNRDRFAPQGSLVVGSNNTFGEDIVLSGVSNRFSYSLGQFHFETDGFRENNDLNQNILNAFGQFQLSYKTSLQAEIRSTDNEKGDLRILFDPDNFMSSLRQEEEVGSLRFGLRHGFGNRSDLLGSAIYQDADFATNIGPDFSVNSAQESYKFEIQHLYSARRWHNTSGVSYLTTDRDEITTFIAPISVPPFFAENTAVERLETDQTSIYSYTNLNYLDGVIITIGGSMDFLDGQTVDQDQFNPKIGVTWEPVTGTSLRAAAFRTLQGPLISKQNIQPSLEPTQVAGFNQFFFGVEGEDTWNYGVGIDQKFSTNLYAGGALSRRDRQVPYLDFTALPPIASEADVEENLGRAYLYWTPNTWLALSAEYQYERLDNDGQTFGEGATKVRTHRLPLEISYFHKSGFSAGFTTTYVDQKGDFQDSTAPGLITPGQDKFWVFDVAAGYRLPKRFGVIGLQVNNLLDESFQFQDVDPENPRISPERLILLKITLAY
jgi:tetratricopeptide (TPR) repeat protein